MILALAGGIGGAKLAKGLADLRAPGELIVVVNTGDDFRHLGLHISPDLDTVMYTLAGCSNPQLGWGIAGDTWNFMRAIETLGGETWFKLGDQDLATHVARSARLQAGETLSAVTAALSANLGVRHRIVPMSDQAVRTVVHTPDGPLPFQEYFVRRQADPVVTHLEFQGAELARPSRDFHTALDSEALSAIVICPSNPYLSISPILAIPGIKDALLQRRVPVVAISPIVDGAALKGPAAKIMRELGKEPSALEVARFYAGLIDALVIDTSDASLKPAIARLGIEPLVTPTIMHSTQDRVRLARESLAFAHSLTRPARRAISA